jgi:hypothetical protein
MPRRRATLAACAGALSLATACGILADSVPETSACRNLTYDKKGPTRAAYLPCAGEIIAAVEELEEHTEAALNGDAKRRSQGRATLTRVIDLMKSAGGMQLLERWNDPLLTEINVDVNNALSHYSAFYLLPIKSEPHPFAAETKEAARAEMLGGRRNYMSARTNYRRAGGR